MTDKKYLCEKCEIRKFYAKVFDIHFDHIDCFYECPFVEGEVQNNDR